LLLRRDLERDRGRRDRDRDRLFRRRGGDLRFRRRDRDLLLRRRDVDLLFRRRDLDRELELEVERLFRRRDRPRLFVGIIRCSRPPPKVSMTMPRAWYGLGCNRELRLDRDRWDC